MEIRELCAECGSTHNLQLVRCMGGCDEDMTVCVGCLEDVERRYTCEFCLEELEEAQQEAEEEERAAEQEGANSSSEEA